MTRSTKRGTAAATHRPPQVTHQHEYEPPRPAERLDVLEVCVGQGRVALERLERIGTGEPPRWALGIYQRTGTGPDGERGEFGELGELTLAEVEALHDALGAVLAEVNRRGLDVPTAAGDPLGWEVEP